MCIVGGDAFLTCGSRIVLANQIVRKSLAAWMTCWQSPCCWITCEDRSMPNSPQSGNSINILHAPRQPLMLYRDKQIPLSFFGDFHQVCTGNPLNTESPDTEGKGKRRERGMFYTPAPIVDYLVANSSTTAGCLGNIENPCRFPGHRIDILRAFPPEYDSLQELSGSSDISRTAIFAFASLRCNPWWTTFCASRATSRHAAGTTPTVPPTLPFGSTGSV